MLSLAKNALNLFESSEVEEKRALLNYLLQNCEVSGKKLEFSIRSPFNHILDLTKRPIGLRVLDEFRTLDWLSIEKELQYFNFIK